MGIASPSFGLISIGPLRFGMLGGGREAFRGEERSIRLEIMERGVLGDAGVLLL